MTKSCSSSTALLLTMPRVCQKRDRSSWFPSVFAMAPDPQDLPDYERQLLTAMAYFLGRDPESQARACLCMYLRQAEPRIMAQVRYYAHRLSIQTGQPMGDYDLLALIAQSPDRVSDLLPDLGQVHDPHQPDVFS